MLPSFYLSGDKGQVWSVARAAAYGGCIGAIAALFKVLGPLHEPFAASKRMGDLLASVTGNRQPRQLDLHCCAPPQPPCAISWRNG